MAEEAGVSFRIYERGNSSSLWFSYTATAVEDGQQVRKKKRHSLKTGDRKLAEQRARALAREIASLRLTGLPGSVTIGQVFQLYRQHKLPNLSGQWKRAAETRLDLFERAWGRALEVADVDQTRVDTYARRRMSGGLSPLQGAKGRGKRKPRPVRAGTVDADFRWLSSVFNFAHRHKRGGRRVLPDNPLQDVEWPKEKNVRRPVASQDRYTRTQEHTDSVDPTGRLRCILALARHTGRRESAVCGLRAADLLLSEERVREALAEGGLDEATRDPETGDELYPFGAIYWSPETDKQKLLHVTAISQEARAELDIYLRRNPRVGHVPLFPSDGSTRKKKEQEKAADKPATPIRRDVAARWLLKTERLAKLPKLAGGVFHPYRRLWATERQHLSDVAVAAAGGWSDTTALKASYQKATKADVLRAIRGG